MHCGSSPGITELTFTVLFLGSRYSAKCFWRVLSFSLQTAFRVTDSFSQSAMSNWLQESMRWAAEQTRWHFLEAREAQLLAPEEEKAPAHKTTCCSQPFSCGDLCSEAALSWFLFKICVRLTASAAYYANFGQKEVLRRPHGLLLTLLSQHSGAPLLIICSPDKPSTPAKISGADRYLSVWCLSFSLLTRAM